MLIVKKIILFIFIASMFVACKKEELPSNAVMGQPVFSFSGAINGTSTNWQAGINNYYMYSSYTQDSGVYGFIGNLQSTATNRNSIQISINDYKVSGTNASVASHIDSSFSLPDYYYTSGSDTTGYSINFTPVIYAGSPTSYSWNFGDGSNASSTELPTHVYSAPGTWATSLNIGFLGGTHVVVQNPVTIYRTQPQLWIDSISSISQVDSSNTYDQITYTATIAQGGTPPYTYTWNYGDGSPLYSTTSGNYIVSVVHRYTSFLNQGKIDTAILTVKDKKNNTEIYNYPVWVCDSAYKGSSLMDYRMSPPAPVIKHGGILSNITITYTDGSGNAYTSRNNAQPAGSSFKINSISSYKNNLNNNPTKMLNITFNCLLYNGSNSIQAAGTAIIAVAYH